MAFNSTGALIGGTQGQKAASNVIFGNKPQTGFVGPTQTPPAPALPPHPTTNAPIKSQVTKTASGDIHTTNYDTSGGTSSKTPAIDSGGNVVTPDPNTGMINTGGSSTPPPAPPTTPTYAGLVGGASTSATGNQEIGQRAADIAAQYGKQISDVGQQGAGQAGGYLTGGMIGNVGTGNEAIIANTVAQRQQALAQGESAALQGTGQQLTANQQQTTGLTNLANLTPEALRYGDQFGGGVAAPANVKSIQDLTTQNNAMTSTASGAEANMKLAIDTAKQGGINDTSVPFINAAKQKLGVGFESNPAVINFRATLGAVRSMYASILGGGESTDQTRATALSLVPDDISLDALSSLATQLSSEVQNRVAGNNETIKNLQGGGTNQGGASYTSKSGVTYKLPY